MVKMIKSNPGLQKSLLGYEEKDKQTSTESTRGDENRKGNEDVKADKIAELSAEAVVNKNASEKGIDKSKASKENFVKNGALERTKIKFVISRKKESAVFLAKNKEKKQKNKSKEETENDMVSDDSKNEKKKKVVFTKSSALQSISKSYSTSESDSDNSEKHKTKSSSHQSKSLSKKSSQHKRKDSRNGISYSDAIPYEKVGLRSVEFPVKQEVVSSDEESLSSSFSKKAEITVKEEVLSDKDKKKSSKSSKKRYDDSRSHNDSRSGNDSRKRFDDSLSHDDTRNRDSHSCNGVGNCDDSRSHNAKRNLDDSRNHNDNRNGNDSRSHDDAKEHNDSPNHDDARELNNSRNHDNARDHNDSQSQDDPKERNDSPCHDDDATEGNDSHTHDVVGNHDDTRSNDIRNHDDSGSRDDTRNREDSRKNHISSDDDSRNRTYDDSNSSNRNSIPHEQREMKQEIKQEPGTASSFGPNDFYCDVCKLILNSETTFSSHMAGKRHKKALRQLSEQEVAKSSVLEITESQNFPKPPDVDRIELYDEESRIQATCEDADLLIVGLDYVREIRGYEDTKYFCDLCCAQCVANSIIKHLIGFKHQMNCLKQYCARSYNWVKDLDKRDKRVDRELKLQLEEAKRLHGKGRIRVFEDVKRNQRSPESYYPYQPSSSRPVLLPGDVQGKNTDELTVTDEDCLSRDFSDFYCKVCDSHMNNYSMWESHARGKRHAKNKKKAPIGLVTNSNFVEAPRGTISHLEEMIYEQCGPNDIIVGLNFIRENQGENGDLYNCYLCGSVCPTIDIVDHLYLKKHKTKYLEKMLSDGFYNAINEISSLPIGETAREGLIDDECEKLMIELGRGRPVICVTKKIF
ncbi:unnamed protein product [Larinioides sclopetarius]|uniref:Matrin-type domain-containing protein n=1 Tax=Larinioides sclopetarius TaxID=280406 RepID=A0AAV2BI12_9ARAC